MRLCHRCLALLLIIGPASLAAGQELNRPEQTGPSQQAVDVPALRAAQRRLNGRNCPGDPPGNLASIDCRFTPRMRLVEFVATSVTDQAVSGAASLGLFAFVWHRDPEEWGRGWAGYGRSFGSRYTQNLAKGSTNYVISAIIQADPRHVTLANDPGVIHEKPPSGAGRVGHALLDWITVRKSDIDGAGRRLPNVPLWAGAGASAWVNNAWRPKDEATATAALVNASSSLATALVSSFYTEFFPEISRGLGAVLKRGRTPSAPSSGSQP
jgi:hypothetical protein